jgi:hypothetical protein
MEEVRRGNHQPHMRAAKGAELDNPAPSHPRLPPRTALQKKISIVGATEGGEVEAGAGEEAFEQAGPVLHSPEPGFPLKPWRLRSW